MSNTIENFHTLRNLIKSNVYRSVFKVSIGGDPVGARVGFYTFVSGWEDDLAQLRNVVPDLIVETRDTPLVIEDRV